MCGCCESALFCFVFAATFLSFNFYRYDVPCGEVVRAGTHVEIAQFTGEPEGFQQKPGADPWHGFCGPFVEIHVCVDAAGLLVEMACIESWLDAVEGFCGTCEEAEGIVMCAGDRVRLDEGIDFMLGQAERGEGGMTNFLAAVNHRPFVHAVTCEVRRSVAGCDQEVDDPLDAVECAFGDCGLVDET